MKSSFARSRTKDAKIIGGTANLDGSHLQFIESFMIQPYCRTSKTHAAREIDTNGIDSAELRKQACRPEDRAKYLPAHLLTAGWVCPLNNVNAHDRTNDSHSFGESCGG